MPDDSSPRPLRRTTIDHRALRVLAHPLRARLLGLLRLDGPATATTLARRLDTNTGATSYHLRKLAEVGLVEESPGGVGRERRWQAAHDLHSWTVSDFVGDPDAEAAREWLESEYFRQFLEYFQRWTEESPTWPLAWRDAAAMGDMALELDPARLQALRRELFEVIERYRDDEGAVAGDRRRVLVYVHAFPDTRAPAQGEA